LEAYLGYFDEVRGTVENLLEMTVDFSQITGSAVDVLTVRYLAAPPISADDLKVVSDARLTATALREDPDMARRVIDTILLGLDRNRFPWSPRTASRPRPSAARQRWPRPR
jgi:hypothetical protein